MANRRGPSRAPTETSASRQFPPRKENRWLSARCVRRVASIRTCCRRGEKEGPRRTRATTSQGFWAAGNRRSGVFARPRVHSTGGSRKSILCCRSLPQVGPQTLLDAIQERRETGKLSSRVQRGTRCSAESQEYR